jgi:hypothetical protein
VTGFVGVVSFFVAYHFIVGGVPLFADDVELKRFSFLDSGLFGVPGRMYLYGLPFLAAYVSRVQELTPSKSGRQLRNFVWAEFVLAMILSGFKGSLIQVLVIWILIRSVSNKPLTLRATLRLKYVAVLVTAILFGALIAQRYGTLEITGPSRTATYLAARSTVIAAGPGALAVRILPPHPTGFYHTDDFIYYTQKYLRIPVTDREVFPMEKLVSAQLSNTELDEGEFIVAVTVGAFAGFVVDFGMPVAFILMLCVGMLYGWIAKRTPRTRSPFAFAAFVLILRSLDAVIVNGGLAYYIFNIGLMLLILLAIHKVCEAMASDASDVAASQGNGG